MEMFCYQCEEASNNIGCKLNGICGKNQEVSKLQDLLIYCIKGISEIVTKGNFESNKLRELNHQVLKSLFITITNSNFDEIAIKNQIRKMLVLRDKLKKDILNTKLGDASTFEITDENSLLQKASKVGVLATQDEDIRSLRELITYGIKGIAAYAYHALNLGKENFDIYSFIYKAMFSTIDDNLSSDELLLLVLKTGEFGVITMSLLDEANTSKYGNPEITNVNIGVGKKPGILISGHDLHDLEQLLEQTKGTNIDVYTHSEMLPAHYYPFFKKYGNLMGNYGGSWWKQIEEFQTFNGPILFTTNCIVPKMSNEIKQKVFTSGASGCPGCKHIEADDNNKKDFSDIISLAKECKPPTQIESGNIVGGFAHAQVLDLADKVVDAVKSGAIKKFFVMAGCDGRSKSRNYYTEFAQKIPKDTVILTAGCAKYRYNKLDLGTISQIPRILDAGQCNDSYSLVVIALKLKDAFGLDDINDLPIFYNIAWYEQKAVIVLLALLHLGIKNIHLGPTLPSFLSPNVAKILIENFKISGIDTVENDIKLFMK